MTLARMILAQDTAAAAAVVLAPPTAAKVARARCGCCQGSGEHQTGHECYRCDGGGSLDQSEAAAPPCAEVYRDPELHAERCPTCRPVSKGASDPGDPNPVDPEHVLALMRANFPDKALRWVRDARWIGPVDIPTDRVDADDVDAWAASHQRKRVRHFQRRIKAGEQLHPAVVVQEPGEQRVKIIDGHHRYLAVRAAGKPLGAYVGFVDSDGGPWDQTHAYQVHHGTDPANKAAKQPVAAGLAVRAVDTGRVLMLQRAPNPTVCTCGVPIAWDEQDGYQHTDGSISHDDADGTSVSDRVGTEHDPAAGYWEFPGGKLDEGEAAEHAARREWAEETGCRVPDGKLVGGWSSNNGVYRGFVLSVPSEDAVPIFDGRDQVTNPDDPDGDQVEALAWWDPEHLADNPAVRPELAEDLAAVLRAVRKAPTTVAKCLTCGCHHPGDDHGDPGRLTLDDYDEDLPDRPDEATLAYLHDLFDEDGTERFLDSVRKVEEGPVGRYRARHLIRWYNRGAGGRIPWGSPGDFDACVAVASEHMPEKKAKGFCNLRHHDALGIYPATHAAAERHATGRKSLR